METLENASERGTPDAFLIMFALKSCAVKVRELTGLGVCLITDHALLEGEGHNGVVEFDS